MTIYEYKTMGIKEKITKNQANSGKTYPLPEWVPRSSVSEKELCPDCFKVVGEKSRYNMVCLLGAAKGGMTVGELTEKMNLQQPTISHHLQVLESVNAVESTADGRKKIYTLKRDAHCFEDCKIPY